MVGNPMLSQIRDFIDADAEPEALDPIGIVRRAFRGKERRVACFALSCCHHNGDTCLSRNQAGLSKLGYGARTTR